MKRLLIFGLSPLPFENTIKNFGPGIRAWQFCQPLMNTDHEILLVGGRIPYIYEKDTPSIVTSRKGRMTYTHVDSSYFNNPAFIQKQHDDFEPDAVLAATIFSTVPLHHLKTDKPVWIDLFGHVMAEAQAKAFKYRDDQYFHHFWSHEFKALTRADIFSCVSRPQMYATVGELGFIGRLSSCTTGYMFCHTIPCAIDPEPLQHQKQVLRGIDVPDDAFIVLWSGGFNTWTDIDTLVAGLEKAMETVPSLYFVSTGGQIDGHDELTYPYFKDRIGRSRFSSRFVLKGWLPKQEVADYYFEANIGINIDKFMYEGMFGSKNRVLDWMRAGLPSLIGELCEISYEFPRSGIAYSFKLGDPDDLAGTLVNLAHHPDEVKETGIRAYDYALNHLTFEATTAPFRQWLQNPRHAPDWKKNLLFVKTPLDDYSPNRIQALENEIAQKNCYLSEMERTVASLESAAKEKTTLSPTHTERFHTNQDLLDRQSPIKITYIIVSWNGVDFLSPCIQSIVDQKQAESEIIIVDNGSTDGSCEHITDHFPSVRLKRNSRNLGFTLAVNQGIEAALGNIIVLINQDAELHPGYTESILQAFRDHPSAAIAGCKVLDMDGQTLQHAGGIVHKNGLTNHYGAGEIDHGQYDQDRFCDYVTGAAFAFKKELVQRIGLFDKRFSPAYFEELDYCVRARRSGYSVIYAYRAKLLHHESVSTGKFTPRFYTLYHRNRLKFIMKHHPMGYIIREFIPFEYQWIKHHLPREQVLPLVKAYIHSMLKIPWLLIRPLVRKQRS